MEHKKEKELHTQESRVPLSLQCGAHKTLTSGKKASWNMELAIYRCYLGVGDLGETHIHTQAARRMGRRAWLPAQAPGRSRTMGFCEQLSYTVLTARWTGGLASRRSIRNCLCSFSRAISPLLRGGSGHSAVCPHNAQKLTHTRQQNQKNIRGQFDSVQHGSSYLSRSTESKQRMGSP